MRCPVCSAENSAGMRFCEDCGTALAAVCASCGADVSPGKPFCGHCGSPMTASAPAVGTLSAVGATPSSASSRAPSVSGPASELRHVSVLFCDLVGFTPLARRRRDPEEVRELLSGYFELARAIVARYGGVVEKFIGDAVMAVWGAPVAKEDDAERAVRAGLELVSAVAAYGSEHATDLQARVGIVTGGAATTETAEEGLVIGDRVNTAARIQSAAPPGCCYVDETTRAATAAAIAYVDAGEHELKGKAEPVRLYQATRVVAAVAGSQRSGVLEAPFIGRDHELRLVKELFHASAERHSARLVLVSGVAGVGKSRLAWEFFKYIDGLAGNRALARRALPLLRRGRELLGAVGDGPSPAPDQRGGPAGGRRRAAPHRASSAGSRTRPTGSSSPLASASCSGCRPPQVLAREELFSGWRLFFERLSEHLPVVMVVEDLQWADAGMVDFLDHLLEWSGDHAIFLLVLYATGGDRPQRTRALAAGASRPSRSTRSLTRSSASSWTVSSPACPPPRGRASWSVPRASRSMRSRPCGACSTRASSTRDDDGALHLVGELGELEIPPGLTALIASRLDALEPDERRLVKECSVLGASFPRQAIEAVSDTDPAELDELLSSLVRKEVLTVRADKLSPERGQYAFTQSLIRSVAYDMLTRAERKARHLRTAEHLRSAFPDEGAEVAEVIAAHLYDAYKAAGDDPDADELRVEAQDAYVARRRASRVRRRPRGGRVRLPEGRRAELGRGRAGRPFARGRAHGLARRLERTGRRPLRGGDRRPHAGRADRRRRPGHRLARPARSTLSVTDEQAIVLIREALASLDPDTGPARGCGSAPATARQRGLLLRARRRGR